MLREISRNRDTFTEHSTVSQRIDPDSLLTVNLYGDFGYLSQHTFLKNLNVLPLSLSINYLLLFLSSFPFGFAHASLLKLALQTM